MSVRAVVGANWGDEGKGKIVDYLAGDADFVVRFQGGANAGHTIVNDYGRFALHLLPSGVFHPAVCNLLGPGVALNVESFLQELAGLKGRKVPTPHVYVSERAQVVAPYHLLLDAYEEARLGGEKFGSTLQGIAPFYADKVQKVGIQVADLHDAARLTQRVAQALVAKNVLFRHLYNKPELAVEPIVESLLRQGEALRPYVCDTHTCLSQAMADGQTILLEGQLGALRDPDHGIYPYPTSSSPLAGFATVGAGVPPYAIQHVIAVAKAYSSCVGAGPFVTELHGEAGEELRRRGGDKGEYGATTGRPRRVGWFDAVATRYGVRVQGATEVALTLLDVLAYREEIPVCTGYEVEGQRVETFPPPAGLAQATPQYEMLPGWREDVGHVRRYGDLPLNARRYVTRIEELVGVPIRWISVGAHRNAIILL